MTEVQYMREIENLEALVKSLEQSNERLKQSVVDLLQERVDDAILMHKAADEIERLRLREKDITLEGLALIGRIEQTREALAGPDAASLPRDYPLERMAQDRMAEIERLRAALKEIRDAGPMTLDDQRWRVALAALGGEND